MENNKINGGSYLGIKVTDELNEALFGFTLEQKIKLFEDCIPDIEINRTVQIPIITGVVDGIDAYNGSLSVVDLLEIDELGQYKKPQ